MIRIGRLGRFHNVIGMVATLSVATLSFASTACGDDGSGGAGGSDGEGGAGEGAGPITGGGDAGGAGGSGAGGEGASSQGGSGGDGGGSSESSCTFVEGIPVPDDCGIFIDGEAADGGTGTKAAPYNTVTAAIQGSPSARYYVCEATQLNESVTVPSGVSLFGGLDCTQDWAWTTTPTSWTSPSDTILITVDGAEGITNRIEGFSIVAPNAIESGESSIAIAAALGHVEVARTDLYVGNGANGTDGTAGVNGTYQAEYGNGYPGTALNTCTTLTSAAPGGLSGCGVDGGRGAYFRGTLNFLTIPATAGMVGQDNAGTNSSNTTTCTNGGPGALGTDGPSGTSGMGVGEIDLNGYTGIGGINGIAGTNGGGGGGGGAKRHLTNGECDRRGTGGGGGAGGCAGTAGTAGMPGGSSIAMISIGATWSFDSVTISMGNGGNGGVGGAGSFGADGGFGGSGAQFQGSVSCGGGDGGDGGDGGAGGSGAGGHSLVIAHSGAAPSLFGLTILVPPTVAGVGGPGATDGVAAQIQSFD